MSNLDWHELYRDGITPWEDGRPWRPLVPMVSRIIREGGRILDVGCGIGTQALHLAEAGYSVTGIDIVESAVEAGRSLAAQRNLKVKFKVADFYTGALDGPYDLVFDRSVMSNCENVAERLRFAERVASVLKPNGWWLDVTGCADNRDSDGGPDRRGYPRLSLSEIVTACEPRFQIDSVKRLRFGESPENNFTAWIVLLQIRLGEGLKDEAHD